jgi:hypothetical protein
VDARVRCQMPLDVVLPAISRNERGLEFRTHVLSLLKRFAALYLHIAHGALPILRHCLLCAMEKVMISEEAMTSEKTTPYYAF